jgi:uncharacterized protein YuzE
MTSSAKDPGGIRLEVSPTDPDVAYLYLPDHPGRAHGARARQVRLASIIPGYRGADLVLDFDKHGRVVGVEVLA